MVDANELQEAIKQMADTTGAQMGDALSSIIESITTNDTLPKDAIGLNDNAIEAIYAQAYHNYNAGKYSHAAHLFHMLHLLDATEPKYQLGLAACYQMLGEYENALLVYGFCQIIDPENPVPHYHASDCYLKQDLIPACIAELQMAVDRCGNEEQYRLLKERAILTIQHLKEHGKPPSDDQLPSIELSE